MANPAILPDLVTPAQLAGSLAPFLAALTPEQTATLPALTAAASASVRRYCKRLFTAWQFIELCATEPPGREITLRHVPVLSVESVAAEPAEAITLTAGPAAQRAAVTLEADGSDGLGFTPTGVRLDAWASGVKSTATVPLSAAPTVAGLAAALSAAGGPTWSAAVAPGLGLYPAADVAGPLGTRSAAGGKSAALLVYADELDYSADTRLGVLTLGPDPSGPADSPRWGPGFGGGGPDSVAPRDVRVVYTAGFAATPADVALVVAELVKLSVERVARDTSLKSESDGVLSWSAGDVDTIPAELARRLNPYVNHRG